MRGLTVKEITANYTPTHTHLYSLKGVKTVWKIRPVHAPKLTALFLFKVSTFLLSTQNRMANQKEAAVDQGQVLFLWGITD